MKNTVIIAGAGQMGKAAAGLINEAYNQVVAFSDNAWEKVRECAGKPVISMEEAVKMKPDGILIAVAGKERADALREQLQALGYTGRIEWIGTYSSQIDIRKGTLLRLVDTIEKLPGDIAELGVFRGEFSRVLNTLFPERTLHLFDTFEGFDDRDLVTEAKQGYSKARKEEFADTSAEYVISKLLHPEQAVIHKGYFPDTTDGVEAQFVFVSLDVDLYEPTLAGLIWFMPRMISGGVIMLHDYNNPRFGGVKKAVEEYERQCGRLCLIPLSDLHGSAVIVKS